MQQIAQANVSRFLQRDAGIASKLVNIYKLCDQILQDIAKLPAQPVAGPPPGLPVTGGAAMAPLAEASPFG